MAERKGRIWVAKLEGTEFEVVNISGNIPKKYDVGRVVDEKDFGTINEAGIDITVEPKPRPQKIEATEDIVEENDEP